MKVPLKTRVELLYDPAIPLLGIYLDKTLIQKDSCNPMFIAAQFTIVKTWKQLKCPLTDEWKKMWYIHTMEYCVCCVLSCFSHVQFFATLWTAACQAPLSKGFSRQEYWSGLPCPPPEDLPNPVIKPTSLYISCIGRWVLHH